MGHSRRKALTAGLALAFAAPAAALARPADDAELVRLCARFDLLEQQAVAVGGDHQCESLAERAAAAEQAKIAAQQEELVDRIVDLPCTTVAGVFAIGRSLAGYLDPSELEEENNHDTETRLLAALLRTITQGQVRPAALASALPAPVSASTSNPDAALIALCERYGQVVREYRAIGAQGFYLDFSDPEYQRIDRAACALIPGLHAMREQIAETPAVTIDGVRAKATAARYWLTVDGDDGKPALMRDEDGPSWSLVQDLLRIV